MKTRQFVWNDQRIIDFVKQNCVSVVASDVEYSQNPSKEVWEYRQLARIFESEPGGIHQGIFMATPSGRMIRNLRYGWPDPDPVRTLEGMRTSLSEYQSMSKSSRLASSMPEAREGKLRWEKYSFTKPAGTLDLRVVTRSYAFDGMTSFDERHPMFFGLDRLWFKPSEFQTLIPSDLRVGASVNSRAPVLERIISLCHLLRDCSPWSGGDIKKAELKSTISSINKEKVSLRFEADISLSANSQYNKGKYDGKLLGKAVYNSSSNSFESFEMVSLGVHTVGIMKQNMHAGSPTSSVASFITLNPPNADEDNYLLPARWKWGYPRNWSSTP